MPSIRYAACALQAHSSHRRHACMLLSSPEQEDERNARLRYGCRDTSMPPCQHHYSGRVGTKQCATSSRAGATTSADVDGWLDWVQHNPLTCNGANTGLCRRLYVHWLDHVNDTVLDVALPSIASAQAGASGIARHAHLRQHFCR